VSYPHWLRIGPAGAGSMSGDADTGEWTPDASAYIYDGPADVQDVGKAIVYGQESTGADSNATAFLESSVRIHELQPGMAAVVVWNPGAPVDALLTDDAELSEVTVLDGTVGLRWL
jgi:hypothetical protein